MPSASTVENNTYKPLSRPIFIYVNAKSTDKAEITEFIHFYMKNAPTLVTEVKYFPLSKEVYDLNIDHLNKKKVGTVFKGSGINIKLEDILKLESSL